MPESSRTRAHPSWALIKWPEPESSRTRAHMPESSHTQAHPSWASRSTAVPPLSSGKQPSSTHCLWMRWAQHLCLLPFQAKQLDTTISTSVLLVSECSELLSCVTLVEPRSCACLFWCQTEHIGFVSKLIDTAAHTADVSRVFRVSGRHSRSGGSRYTEVFGRSRQGCESYLFLQQRCWAEMCLEAFAEGEPPVILFDPNVLRVDRSVCSSSWVD